MNNYLLKSVEKYFDEILSIEGKLTVSEAFLTERKNDILKEKREHKDLVSAITTYRDLSFLDAEINLFTPNYSYSFTIYNLESEIKDIISQHCCFAVSQAYEVFESFLIEILTEFLSQNQKILSNIKFVDGDIILLKETIREMIKSQQKTNNKGLLKIIRKISVHFKKYEAKNIHGVNISNWFDIISMTRHTLVHNRQIISSKLLRYLKDNKAEEIFDRHFKRKKIGNNVCIYLERNSAIDTINWLNSFAHFIFKGLSIEANLTPAIPQYVLPPRNLSRFSW